MTPKRTEYGKSIRKEYESHLVYEHRANMTQLSPRIDGLCNTLTTVTKDNYVMAIVQRTNGRICAMRGRNPDNPSDRTRGIYLEQRLEIGGGVSNTLTTVGKDNLILAEVKMEEKTLDDYLYHGKDGNDYGIFKLSHRECLRLMDVSDDDIDKMESVNSNSQCYKQAGNSIVVNVLVAIFGQLFEGKENFYKQGGLVQANK